LLDVSFGSVSTPAGGGILGGGIYRALEAGLGKAGTMIILVAWLLVSLILLIDLSMSDLVSWLAENSRIVIQDSLISCARKRKNTTGRLKDCKRSMRLKN